MLIVLEGLDACGKTTQSKMLVEYFEKQGKTVYATAQPSGSSIGKDIKSLLVNHHKNLVPMSRWLLHCSSHAQHWAENIIPALERGEVVILDRCWLSAMAYSGVEGIDLKIIYEMELRISRYIVPDMVFLFENEQPFTLEDEIQDNNDHIWRQKVLDMYKFVLNSCTINDVPLLFKIIKVDNKTVNEVFEEIKNNLP